MNQKSPHTSIKPKLQGSETLRGASARLMSPVPLVEDVPSGGHVRLEDKVVKDVEEGEDLVERHRHAHGAEELQVLGEEALVQEDPQRHRRLEPKQFKGNGAKVTAKKKASETHSTHAAQFSRSYGLSSVPITKSSTKPPWVCQ